MIMHNDIEVWKGKGATQEQIIALLAMDAVGVVCRKSLRVFPKYIEVDWDDGNYGSSHKYFIERDGHVC